MSMLAEPRRKQKWSIDPRNSAWSKDESKFGQKMLERMGWSKGKGLGRTEQGSTEHIKVKVKNNQLGLGTTASHEDNWIAHQDDFNQLLADLNNCHGQNTANGKDLSSRSQTDLACIFGKRGTKRMAEDQEEESSGPDSQGVNEKETRAVTAPATKVTTPEPDVEAITKTVTSTLSMQEYFAQRMAQLKKGHGEAPTATSSPENSDTQQVTADFVTDHTEEVTSKKKKKKKRRKREREEDDVVVKEECVVAPVSEGREKKREGEEDDVVVKEECVVAPVSEGCEKKKKKRKRKRAEKEVLAEDCSATTGVEQNCQDRQIVDLTTECEVVNKKWREEVVVVEDEEVVVVEDEKKSKKNKRKKIDLHSL
ncbi:PIN2/TERF1-interacting telomerase inhibitor 1 isoform X2 [Salvelinus namaycush]|uniref:PIN2/TERF1-interacting telomerase inhibitor 1 isoform X2 n=1 Tax=Salvelinus namaycush TaxID=8040 RepID=A0A8U0P3L8_SALNM|nr:PIN2/TERF1-interacting telomerase inhibitor 1 isoform X2 [Salvelinus namaycush]